MTGTVGFYAFDGSLNATGVDGTTYTGVYAADGSVNIIPSPGNVYVGAYHPCGAWYITVAPTNPTFPLPYRAPDGSLYIVKSTGSGFANAITGVGLGTPVTIVGGIDPFGPPPGNFIITESSNPIITESGNNLVIQ